MASCWGKEVYLDPISDFHDPRQEIFNNPNLGSVKRRMNPSVLGDMRLWDGRYWAYSFIATMGMGSEDGEKSGRRKKRESALGKGQPAEVPCAMCHSPCIALWLAAPLQARLLVTTSVRLSHTYLESLRNHRHEVRKMRGGDATDAR